MCVFFLLVLIFSPTKTFPLDPQPFDFKTVWFIFCTDLALCIFSSKQLLASSIRQVQLKKKVLFMQVVPMSTKNFMLLTTAFNCAILIFFLFFLNQAET